MNKEEIGDLNGESQRSKKVLLRKASRTSLKAFAIFATAMILLSAFVMADIEYSIEVPDDFPWEFTFYPGPLGNYAKLTFKNASEDTPVFVRFENVSTDTELVKNGQDVGDIEAGITNIYIFTIENGTEPYLRFFVNDGFNVKIDQIDESIVGDVTKSHVFGDTFYQLGGKYIADLGFESLEAKNINVTTSGNLTYMGIIEYPAFVDAICRYGWINETTTSFDLPSGTKTLRLVSDTVEDFDMRITPIKMEDVAVIDVIATRQLDGASKYVRTITPVGQYYGIDISCEDQENTVAAGNSTVFTIEIENSGNGNDTVDFEAYGDWNASFINPVVDMELPGFAYTYMVVTAPPGSEGQNKTIQVNATSRGNQSIKSTANVSVYSKTPSFSFDFNSSLNSTEIYPKQSGWYYLSINNTGNVEDTYDLEVISSYDDWTISLDESSVRVDTNDRIVVRMIVTPPLNVTGGIYYLDVNASSHNITGSPETLNLTARVVEVCGVDLTPDYLLKDNCPTRTPVIFPFLVQNSGNVPDTINLSINTGLGFFTDENGTIMDSEIPMTTYIYLGPWESKKVNLNTDTAMTADTITTVSVLGISENDTSIQESITFETHTIPYGSPIGDGDDWAVSMPVVVPGDMIIPVTDKEKLTFEINITNKGDYADNFTITNEIMYQKLTDSQYSQCYNATRNELLLTQSVIDSMYPLSYWAWLLDPQEDAWNSTIYVVNETNPYRIFLDVDESKTIQLNMTVASNAPLGEMARITVRANATGNSSAYDVSRKYFILTKGGVEMVGGGSLNEIFPYGAYPQMDLNARFTLYCNNSLKTARPGNSTTYHIYIKNDDDFDMDFNLSIYGEPEYWQTSLNNNTISVDKYSKKEINLTVTTPQYGVLPMDQDLDGLSNVAEVNIYNTSILDPDKDDDLFWDGAEVEYWSLRGFDTENISLYLNDNDIDNDALLDGEEIRYLTNIIGSSDNDTLEDFFEIHQFFTYEKENIYKDYYPPPPFNISIEFDIDMEDDYRLMLDILNQINTTVNDVNDTEPVVNQIMENITTAEISGEELNFNTYGVPMTIQDMGGNNHNITDDRYYAIYKSFDPGSYNLTIQIDPTSYENTSIYMINVSTFQIQRHGLDPFDEDVDDDGLNDSYEVYRGINPFKVDTDEDGLSDYDEAMIYKSNPKVIDTDYDRLADGYNVTIDGISYIGELAYGTVSTNADSDDDGLCDGFNNTIGGIEYVGELAIGTNPNIWDTDSDTMPDGWENQYGLNPLNSNDANSDNDAGGADNLTNAQEYTVGTDPTDNDCDDDNLTDGDEITGILFRTNITRGADRIDYYDAYYENQTGFKWIYYNGSKYEFNDAYTNETNTSSARYNGTDMTLISVLLDGTTIIYNSTVDEIYVWEPGSDYDDSDQNGTLEGTFYAFNSSSSSEPITTDIPEHGYRYQELYKGTNPRINDTDEDGLFDGDEKDGLSDTDNDGLPNNLDTDSDDDNVIDGQEIGWDQNSDGDAILYNMLDPDSDNDNISDGTESLWYLDIDGDGLENMIDTDSDNDNLDDGVEDWNYNGTLDANETSMIDVDTDNDGIIDSVELNWNVSSDNDTLINARDQDSDNDGVTDGNEVRVVFRTNAINGEYNSSTWVSVALNQSAWDSDTEPPYGYNLTGFWYNASSAEPIGILLGYTFENDEVWYDETNNTVFVDDTKFIYNTSSQIRNSTTPTLTFTKNRGEAIVFYNVTDGDNVYNVLDNDSDDDNLLDGLEDLDNDGIIDMYETDPYMQDTDMDGIPDGIEDANLDGGREAYETDPLDEDSDEDGLWDGWKDIDGDQLYDPFEFGEDTNANGTVDVGETNPLILDTDGDLLRDDFETIDDVFWLEAEYYLATGAEKNASENASTGSEVEFEILSEGDYQICVMVKSITSGSSFTFLATNATSTILINETANIGVKYKWYNTTIFSVDTTDLPITLYLPNTGADSNIRIDKIVLVRTNNVSLVNITNPSDDDSDDDGLSDANERFIYQTYPFDSDTDNDGLQDGTELGITTSQGDDTSETFQPDIDPNSTTNPRNMDVDYDGLPDGWIDGWGEFGIVDGFAQPMEGEDFDADGQINGRETNPNKIDSDSDGLNDTYEVMNDVYWYESEDNNNGDITENGTASTGVKVTLPNPSLASGTYMMFVYAKSDVTDKQLTFGAYNDTSTLSTETVTLEDEYRWYNTSEYNVTAQNLPIYLYAPYPSADSEIDVDKLMLIKISGSLDYSPVIDNVSDDSLSFSGSENQTTYINITESMYIRSAVLVVEGGQESGSYTENVTLDVGGDGDYEWYNSKKLFNNATIPEFGDELNEYIFNNQDNFTNGMISIPLVFHSDKSGVINISSVEVVLTPDVSYPMDNDTDDDELIDGHEKRYYFTHCINIDSDLDMINDYQELYIDGVGLGTHPGLHDTDKDGLWDGWYDSNQNGIFDIIIEVGEDTNANSIVDAGETNPLDPDTDDDKLYDGSELIPGVAWFEAESHSIGQVVSDGDASGGFSVENATGNKLIDHGSFPSISAGHYILYIKAKSNHTVVQDQEFFSGGRGDWEVNKTGSGTEVNAVSGYLYVKGEESKNASASNSNWTLPSSDDYKIEFDYRYPSGTTMEDFLVWGAYNSSGPDIEIWQSNDKLYVNNDTMPFYSLTNTVWHHFEIVSIHDSTIEIYVDGALILNSTKFESGNVDLFGKVGDTSLIATGTGNWDNIILTEISSINVTVRTSSSGIVSKLFPVYEKYKWYSSPAFVIGEDKNIEIDVNDSASSNAFAYGDKFMLVKLSDGSIVNVLTTNDTDDILYFGGNENTTVYLDLKIKDNVPMYVTYATIDITGDNYGAGLEFSQNIKVNSNAGNRDQLYSSITVDKDGNIYVVWQDDRYDFDGGNNDSYNIYFTKSTDCGMSFSSDIKISDNLQGGENLHPSIANNSDGDIFVAFANGRDDDWHIVLARSFDGGLSFYSTVKVNDDSDVTSKFWPSVATGSSEKVYVVWEDDRNGDWDIYVAESINDGHSFGTNYIVNDDGGDTYQIQPSIAVDSNNYIYVVWQDNRSGNWDIYFAKSTDGGETFTTNIKINDDVGTSNQTAPSLALDENGNIFVVWQDYRDGDWDIYFANSTDGGATFNANIKINDDVGSANQSRPSIAVNNTGNISVVWEDYRNNSWDIYFTNSSDGGIVFSDNIRINTVFDYPHTYPSIAVNETGNIYVTWQDGRDGDQDVYFTKSYNNTLNFSSNIRLNYDNDTANQLYASVAVSPNGDICVVWQDYSSKYSTIYFAKSSDGGLTFGESVKVSDQDETLNQLIPAIFVDDNGYIYVTWGDNRDGDYDIYLAKSIDGGTTFGTNIKVNDDSDSESQEWPAITVDSDSTVYIAWEDHRSGNYDIYLANSTDGGETFGTNVKINDDSGAENQQYPDISVDLNGNLYIVWADRRAGTWTDIYFANSTDGGATFSPNVKVNNESVTTDQGWPSIALDSDGNLYIVWHDNRTGGLKDIYFARSNDGGATFGPNVKVSDEYGVNQDILPENAIDDEGRILVVWRDNRSDPGSDIYFAYSTDGGISFSQNIKVNDDSGPAFQSRPEIAVDDYNIYLVWRDNRDGLDSDIYFATNGDVPTYPYLNLGGYPDITIPRANMGIKDFANCSLEDLKNMNLPQWAWYFGKLTPDKGAQRTLDLSGEINQYIRDNIYLPGMVNESGYIKIPLEFHSDTAGKLILSNIRVLLAPYVTDPLDDDTDNDGLIDSDENLIWTSSLKWDSDNDGLWDVVEPVKGIKTDPLDSDTENDLLMDGNPDEIKVIFRSGASNGTFVNYTEGTWVASQKLIWINALSRFVPVSEYSRLVEYGFDRNATSLPAEYAAIIINTTEDYALYYINSTKEIYVKLGESDYKVYNLSDSDAVNAINLTSPQMEYAIENREIYSNAALTADKDNDGLIDGIEQSLGLTPEDADWDDDGLLDGVEHYLIGSDPTQPDHDYDGLWDGLEVGITLAVVWEIKWNLEVNQLINGTNLTVFADHYDFDPFSTTDPLIEDTDKDGIWDGFNDLNDNEIVDDNEPSEDRNLNGKCYDENETNPNDPDTDGDGLYDGYGENKNGDIVIAPHETNPLDVDSDDDGLWDGYSINYNGTLYVGELKYNTEQRGNDSDNDNLLDGQELGLFYNSSDISHDNIFDDSEAILLHPFIKGTNISNFISDIDPSNTTDPKTKDTDGDGLEDGIEDENLDGYFEDNKQETDPLNPDTDFDGLSDGEEDTDKNGVFDQGSGETDANDADTDDDGLKDSSEVQRYSDTDGDGLINSHDIDSDNDGIIDGIEAGITTDNRALGGYGYNGTPDSYIGDKDPDNTTDPLDNDTDDDGLPDGWIDGWIFSWDYGWGNYSSTDGIMDPWEGEDFDCNGSWEPSNFVDSQGQYPNETIPYIASSDGDGIPDGIETYFDLDPLNASDADDDLDSDSLSNINEWERGLDYDNDQHVNFNDTDDDNDYIDTIDEMYYNLNPYYDDSDEDPDCDGLSNIYEYNNSLDLSNPDTDGDNLYDGWEDKYTNGVLDWNDWNGNNRWDEGEGEKPGELYYGTNASNPDTDNDTMWDWDEVNGWYVYIIPDFGGSVLADFVVSSPFLSDEDDDDLIDWQEYENGTNPNSTDTDDDGLDDYKETVEIWEEDPTIIELNPPILTTKPSFGHELKTAYGVVVEKAWLNLYLTVSDDVEIKKIYVDVKDTEQDPRLVFDGEVYTGFKVWGGYIESRKITLDYWQDILWEYTINITIIDVNNNSYMYLFLGGFKADFTGKVGSFIAQYNSFWGGFYTGYFEGLINAFHEAGASLIDWVDMILHPDRWSENIEMIQSIIELVQDFNLTAILEGAVESTKKRAELFYPFTVDESDQDWIDYAKGFVVGSGIGFLWAQIAMSAAAAGVGQSAAVQSAVASFSKIFPTIYKIIKGIIDAYNYLMSIPEKIASYIMKGIKLPITASCGVS